MSRTRPWHSIRTADRKIFHDNALCPAANAIPSKYRKWGHRCRQRCPVCAELGSTEAEARRFALRLPF